MTKKRYICIHGHFYQPPRENPWLEAVETQDSAYPYHDWNERINVECYANNASSRILDDQGKITRIVNNYSRISFNFGPTLLSWMKEKAPETYSAVLAADRESRRMFAGHGSALAQAYNHIILPLAERRDKYTQVLWGIRDFRERFQRDPEGMWLPETAVDIETLEVLAELDIKFTILAPRQAARVRKVGDTEWTDVSRGNIDPTTAYQAQLPSGNKIALFFYDGPVSQAVAFEGLLARGELLAERLKTAFPENSPEGRLAHIATDGETYGHHHKFGDMALAYSLSLIESSEEFDLINYGEYLERHPPQHEVEIIENSSWSCEHGLERWRSDCGCKVGGPETSQSWRAPLREALDTLKGKAGSVLEQEGGKLLHDPFAARDDYIGVILDRSDENIRDFLDRHAKGPPGDADTSRVLMLMEMARHAMLMFTSCGWFFNDISRIETVQILCYAARVVQLVRELTGEDVEEEFLSILEKARSNEPKYGDGRRIYLQYVKPVKVDLKKVCVHFGVSSIFEEFEDTTDIFCYSIKSNKEEKLSAGRACLITGEAEINSRITYRSARLEYSALHLGDHNLVAGVRDFHDPASYERMKEEVSGAFDRADFPQVIRTIDQEFEGSTYTIKALFRDQQRKVINQVLESNMSEGETMLRQFYEHNGPIIRYLQDSQAPLPAVFRIAAGFVLNLDLKRELESEETEVEKARELLREAEDMELSLDSAGLGFALERNIERKARHLKESPENEELMDGLIDLIRFARSTPFDINYWSPQNRFWEMLEQSYPYLKERKKHGEEKAAALADKVRELGELLKVRVD
ncbi:MAG: DUF3536 domain-containing protein [bacterium]